MENAIHRFVRLLRLRGVRISTPEALDAMVCAREPGMLRDKEQLRCALRVALVKDRRDEEVFDEIFDQFFALVKVGGPGVGHGHGHGHDDLSDEGALEDFTLSDTPSDTPQQGHSHGKPVDIRDFFKPEDLAQQYNLHQEANKIDLAAMTDEIVLSKDNQGLMGEGNRVQIETDRLHHAGVPGQISQQQGTKVDADLSVAQQEALLGWLNDVEELSQDGDEDDAAALRRRLTGVLNGLPEAIKRHLEALLALENRVVEGHERKAAEVDAVGEHERMELEESLRRLARSLHGGLTHKRKVSARGRIDSGRTMRRNMRFDGIPFAPVTVTRAEDKPRLVILADVSLSVRSTVTGRNGMPSKRMLRRIVRPGSMRPRADSRRLWVSAPCSVLASRRRESSSCWRSCSSARSTSARCASSSACPPSITRCSISSRRSRWRLMASGRFSSIPARRRRSAIASVSSPSSRIPSSTPCSHPSSASCWATLRSASTFVPCCWEIWPGEPA